MDDPVPTRSLHAEAVRRLALVESAPFVVVAAVLYLAASVAPWDGYGTDLWVGRIGELGALAMVVLLAWHAAVRLGRGARPALLPLGSAALAGIAVAAGAYQLFVVLFRSEPPWFVSLRSLSWGEGAMLTATVLLAVAAGLCLFEHFLAWPSDGPRLPPLPLLVSAAAAVAYVVLAVTTYWFDACTSAGSATGAASDPLTRLFARTCVQVTYRETDAAELTVFLSILVLLAVALLLWGPAPVERLARRVTGGLSFATGVLAALAVAQILRTHLSVAEHLQVGGWLTLLPAVAFLAAGVATLRDA